jgi:hypothetical protein
MSHIILLYALPDHQFARQLAVQLEQRGRVVWPVPENVPAETELAASQAAGLADASHVLGILSEAAVASESWLINCQSAQTQAKTLIFIQPAFAYVPAHLVEHPTVHFEGRFLRAFEELSDLLKKSRAPRRALTVEHPPPVANVDLLPIMFPSERCWREDRLRINYNLPIIVTSEELEMRLPAFLVASHLELVETTKKRLIARRLNKKYGLFDPRRAEHTLTVRRQPGRVRLYYQMTRMQVYHWFPAHYRALDREAAALYRYLATGSLADIFPPVDIQARRARAVSVMALVIFIVMMAALIYLILT